MTQENATRYVPLLVVGLLLLGGALLLAPGRSQLMNHFMHHDEALSILLGRAVLDGQSCDGACAQHTGSVLLHPVLAAMGDRWAGLYGARVMSVLCGITLLLAVIVVGSRLAGRMTGLLAGAIILVQGPFLYVARMGLYDVVAASCLAVAVACLVVADQKRSSPVAIGWLTLAALGLLAAALAKYVTALYLPVALVYVVWRFRRLPALVSFTLPIVALGGWYLWSALMPVWPSVVRQLGQVSARGQTDFGLGDLLVMLGRWLIWPACFAMAGLYLSSRAGQSRAQPSPEGVMAEPSPVTWAVLILLALPIPLAHLVTGSVQGLNKNVVQPLIFLAPAAAHGLLQLTRPFHMRRVINAQWAVIGLVLLAMAGGAVRERTWLEHQYPNLEPVVSELRQLVNSETIVMTDTDALYRYALAGRLPDDQVVLTYWVGYKGKRGEAGAEYFVKEQQPDYIVLDGYYGHVARHQRLQAAMGEHYQLRHRWPLDLSWGRRAVDLYERKGAA